MFFYITLYIYTSKQKTFNAIYTYNWLQERTSDVKTYQRRFLNNSGLIFAAILKTPRKSQTVCMIITLHDNYIFCRFHLNVFPTLTSETRHNILFSNLNCSKIPWFRHWIQSSSVKIDIVCVNIKHRCLNRSENHDLQSIKFKNKIQVSLVMFIL